MTRCTVELYAPSYAPIVERFDSIADALAFVSAPWSVTTRDEREDERPRARSFYPCWPDCREDWLATYGADEDERGAVRVGYLWLSDELGAHESYPDRCVVIGARGAVRLERA